MTRSIVALFEHNLWANLRLLEGCSSLDEATLAAGADGTYGAIGDTFIHLLAAEGRYVQEITKVAPGLPLTEGDAFPGFDPLVRRAQMSGEALIDLAGEMPDDHILRGEYRGQPYVMPAALLLAQAINHATEHRTNITTILSQQGVEAPRLDAIVYFTEISRA